MTKLYALTTTAALIALTACGGGGLAPSNTPLNTPLNTTTTEEAAALAAPLAEGHTTSPPPTTSTTFADFCAQFPLYALCTQSHDEFLAQLSPELSPELSTQLSPAPSRRSGFFAIAPSPVQTRQSSSRAIDTAINYAAWSATPPPNMLGGIASRGIVSSNTVFDSGYLLALTRAGDTNRLNLGAATGNSNSWGFDHALTLGALDATPTITDDGVGFIRAGTTDFYAGVLATTSLASPVRASADNSAIWTGRLALSRGTGNVAEGGRLSTLKDVNIYDDLELFVNYTARKIDSAVDDAISPFYLGDRRANPSSFIISGNYTENGVISGITALTQSRAIDQTPLVTMGSFSGLIGSADGTYNGNRLLAAFVSNAGAAGAGTAGSFVGGFVAKPVPTAAQTNVTYADWVTAANIPATPTTLDKGGAGLVQTYTNNRPAVPADNGPRRWLNLATFDSEDGTDENKYAAVMSGLATVAPEGQASGVVLAVGLANPPAPNTAPTADNLDSHYFTAGLLRGTDLGAVAQGADEVVSWKGRVAGFWGANGHSFLRQQYFNNVLSLCINLGARVFSSHSSTKICEEDTKSATTPSDVATNRTLIRFTGGWDENGVINNGDVQLTYPVGSKSAATISGSHTTLTGLVGERGAVGAFYGSQGTASKDVHFAGGFVATAPAMRLGAPLTSQPKQAAWSGHFSIGHTKDAPVTFNIDFAQKKVTAFALAENILEQSTDTHSFDLDFTDQGSLSGSIEVREAPEQISGRGDSVSGLGIGTVSGLIGQQGLAGVFQGSSFSGDFAAANPMQVNYDLWRASFAVPLPSHPNGLPADTHGFLSISGARIDARGMTMGEAGVVTGISGADARDGYNHYGTGGGAGGQRHFAGILPTTNLGEPLGSSVADAIWNGHITVARGQERALVSAIAVTVNFDLGSQAGTIAALTKLAPNTGSKERLQLRGSFDDTGLIRGTTTLANFTFGKDGKALAPVVNQGNYSAGMLSGLIGQQGIVGVFHAGEVHNQSKRNYAGGFVAKP